MDLRFDPENCFKFIPFRFSSCDAGPDSQTTSASTRRVVPQSFKASVDSTTTRTSSSPSLSTNSSIPSLAHLPPSTRSISDASSFAPASTSASMVIPTVQPEDESGGSTHSISSYHSDISSYNGVSSHNSASPHNETTQGMARYSAHNSASPHNSVSYNGASSHNSASSYPYSKTSSEVASIRTSSQLPPNTSSSGSGRGPTRPHMRNEAVAGIAAGAGLTSLLIVASAIWYILRRRYRNDLEIIRGNLAQHKLHGANLYETTADIEMAPGALAVQAGHGPGQVLFITTVSEEEGSLVPQRSSFSGNSEVDIMIGRSEKIDNDAHTPRPYSSFDDIRVLPTRDNPRPNHTSTTIELHRLPEDIAVDGVVETRPRLPRYAIDVGIPLAGGDLSSSIPPVDDDRWRDTVVSTLPPPYSQYE
ncbi:hypothetical protein C8Q76DRAFT_695771 [Earliella scabrosa]|nr:hypothetical protein C8Q76DRAFT_695771 [Earliella scabrosa]